MGLTFSNFESQIFFTRFFMLLFGGMFPVFMLLIIFGNVFFFDQRLFLKNKLFERFYKYNDSFHFLLFILIWILFFFTTINFFYVCTNIFYGNNHEQYGFLGNFAGENIPINTQDTPPKITPTPNQGTNYYVTILFVGYFLHLLNTLVYSTYSIARTNSFFSKNSPQQGIGIIFSIFIKSKAGSGINKNLNTCSKTIKLIFGKRK